MRKNQKINYYKALLLALSLGVSIPMTAHADEKKQIATMDEENYPEWFKKLIGFSEKAEEEINEHIVEPAISTTDQMRTYDLESLLLISDSPSFEERHLYFINRDSLGVIEWNYYYDKNNNTTQDIENAVQKENRKSYFSITDPNTFYVPRTYINLKTGEVTKNYQEWDEPYFIYDDHTDIKYIVYSDAARFIPQKYLNAAALNGNKISIKELKAAESELNTRRDLYPFYKVDIEEEKTKKQEKPLVLNKQR